MFVLACILLSKPAMSADPQNGCYLGVFREGAPENMAFIKAFEKTFQKKPAMVMWYADYSSDFPEYDCASVYKYGSVPHIVWEPWIWGDEAKIKLKNILSGEWDSYIENWARGAKTFGKTVFVRWGHEFNLDKYPWGVANNGKDPETYAKAFRHVHDIFTRVGVKNVKWIWCFNNYPNPDENWNDFELAYPGDDYVDWIGIDGYNFGTTQSWSSWQTFKDAFRDQIRATSKTHPTKPLMIAEFGCAEEGGNKAAWVKDILPALKVSMKQVKAVLLFDIKKEADWRANSSEKSAAAYKTLLKDQYFLSNPAGIDTLTAVPQTTVRVVTAKKASSPIKINGNFSPFADAQPIVMDNQSYFQEGASWKGPQDLSAKIYLKWDAENLYLYAKVTDSFPMVNSKTKENIWNGDAIEMMVPGYQVGFGTGDGASNKPSIWIWQRKRSPAGASIFVNKTAEPKGYILEASIPWKEHIPGVA